MAVEFVGIELQLRGAEGVQRDLEEIDKLLNSLNGKKTVKSGLQDLKKDALAARGEIDKLQNQIERIQEGMSSGKLKNPAWTKRLEEQNNKLAEQKQRYKDLKRAIDEVSTAERSMGETFSQTYRRISSFTAQLGGRIQTLGKTIGKLTSPLSSLMRGTLFAAGWKAFGLMTEGFSGAFERADTMKNYSRTLEAFGFSAEDSTKAVKELNEAVLGLPTGLDEIVAVQKRFVAASNDIEKSTGLAIAYNNAILASGADARQQKTAQRILTQLAGGADIASSSWDALQRAIPLVFTSLAQESKMGVADYVSALKNGKISTDEFVESFTRLGNTGAIRDAAEVMKKSWGGLASNITNRFRAMGQGIIETLHEVFKENTGRDLLDTLLGIDANGQRTFDGIRDWIDGISESVQGWIKSHPDEIIDFFETLKSIDVKGLLKGIAQGMGDIFGYVKKIAQWASSKDLSKFGRFYTWLLPISKLLTLSGGLLRGSSPVIGSIGALLTRGKGGIFGKIASLFGKKKDVKAAGDVAKAVSSASPSLLSAFKNMALLSGIIAMPAFTAWGVSAAAKNSIKNFKETINLLKDIEWDDAKKVLVGIGSFIGGSAILGGIVGKWGIGVGVDVAFGEVIVGLITSIATGFFDLNMTFIKGGIQNFVESVNLLKEIPDVTSFGEVETKISNAIDLMNRISALFRGRYVDKGVREGGLQGGVGFFTGWNINSIAKALAPLKAAVETINELATMTVSENALNNIEKMIDVVNQIQPSLVKLWGFGYGNIKGNVEKIADALYELRRVIYHVNKLAGEKISDEGLGNIADVINKIKEAFNMQAVGDIRATITGFVASVQDALTELDKLNTPIEIKASVKLASDFDKSVDAVVREIGSAKRRIQLAWWGIPTYYSKTITFSLSARVVAENLYAGAAEARRIADSVRPAKGGLIYRAKGGGVPFRRRGTDTVPAMLTPGEYVHNKRAVNAFGIDFMRKVNNLDMKGAMNELMHRAGNMASVNRGTSITNNNYNNQKVTINNNSAGAGFTFRSASRFVGAF